MSSNGNGPILNKLVIQGSLMRKLCNEIFKYPLPPFLITGVRQFSISFVADFIFCVAHPIVLIYNASVIRHRLVDIIKVYGSYLVELFTNQWINDKRKIIEDLNYDIQFFPLCNADIIQGWDQSSIYNEASWAGHCLHDDRRQKLSPKMAVKFFLKNLKRK